RVDVDPALVAVVDAVAPEAGVRPAMDGPRRQPRARDVAVLELQTPLGDVHADEVVPADLLEREVADPADVGPEDERALPADTHDDVLEGALPDDLERLVDREALLVQPAAHEDARARARGLDRFADRRVVAVAPGVDGQRGRLDPPGGVLLAAP